ncbi:MAG: cytochrome c-type biogenesis protein CcmH [Gammaproteobacteria bacterium]|nr:cytochrome c-type biogenesis protein CcmH [Gammaproteobacteria bacterium]
MNIGCQKPLLITIVLFFSVITSPFGHGQQEIFTFSTAKQETTYQALIKELRCLVCQNQNLADSNAGLAQDLRRKTYEMVIAGETRSQIAQYMVNRYGDFVLYRPQVNRSTFILWFSPFIFLVLLISLAFHFIRKTRKRSQSSDYSEEQLAHIKSLMQDKR